VSVDLSTLYEPLTDDEIAVLAESIRQVGQTHRIVRDAVTGDVLSGRNREAACRLAGVEPRYEDVKIGGPAERLEQVVWANRERRFRPGQREAVIEAFRAAGYTDGRIAAVLGVDQSTISRVRPHADASRRTPRTRTGRDGKKYPTPEALADRRAASAKLYGAGFRIGAIARALNVSSSSITGDLAHEGVDTRAPRRVRTDVPAPVDWRNGEQPKGLTLQRKPPAPPPRPPEAEHRGSRVLRDIDHFNHAAADLQHLKTLACQVANARHLGDAEWLAEVDAAVQVFATTAQRLVQVVSDEQYREAVRFDGSPAAPHLHVVT
jgi:hypothetical protein